MSIFDSIISGVGEKFGLGNKSGALLAALLGLMTNRDRGGFAGFLDMFRNAGLSDTVDSWITTGENTPLSGEQVESALGEGTVRELADQAGTDTANTSSALGYLIPNVVDRLTPDGEVPDETSLLSKIGGYLSGLGGAVAGGLGAAGAAVGGAFDRVDAAADSVGDKAALAYNRADDAVDGDSGGSMLKWLLPLIILVLLVALGWAFCRKAEAPVTNSNANTNVNRANTNAANTTNVNAVNTNTANANAANTATADRKLAEVALPDGTKLQAYPGGIEDQLIKFIQSDEYKNGTADSLKNKWFDFDDLRFVFNKTELVPESKRQLDNIVAILKAFPDVKMKIGAYTDKTGKDADNKKLSDDRAKAVKAALDKAGVGAQVPEAEGYGEEFATVAETASDKEREADRRTAARLLK